MTDGRPTEVEVLRKMDVLAFYRSLKSHEKLMRSKIKKEDNGN
jgi:hypothetical protein